jgi:DNA-binding response OmpR family regulator
VRVLIVEDELTLSQQIQDFFSAKGFAVDVAHTGED